MEMIRNNRIGKYSALQLGDFFLHAYDVIPVNGKE
jgi:hypothetical protein